MKINHDKRSVLKNGKFLMANKNKVRTFKNIRTALQFVFNLIHVSNDLTIDDFKFIRCSE